MGSGVCFKHKESGFHGVVLACEPWCTAPAIWRAQRGASALQRGETQPFYHVAFDDCHYPSGSANSVASKSPGASLDFLPEESMVVCDGTFPVQSKVVDSLLIRCEALGGYLVGPKLAERLRQRQA